MGLPYLLEADRVGGAYKITPKVARALAFVLHVCVYHFPYYPSTQFSNLSRHQSFQPATFGPKYSTYTYQHTVQVGHKVSLSPADTAYALTGLSGK